MNTEAQALASLFERYAIDHKPDGWPAIRQIELSNAAAELRRLDAVNARLLEALKSLAGWFDSDSKESAERHIKKARAAIRAQKGQS